jgi:hypothetical protein
LFLDDSLRDWNLRIILHRLRDKPEDFKSWAVQVNPPPLEQQFWEKRHVDIIDKRLEERGSARGHRETD